MRDGRLVHLVQVGTSLRDTEQTLLRSVETLLILVPLGVALATTGGAAIADAALRPIGTSPGSRAGSPLGTSPNASRPASPGTRWTTSSASAATSRSPWTCA